MRIVIDMQGAQTESRFRGIGRYTMEFTQAVVRNRGDHEIFLVLNGLFPDTIEPIRAAFEGLLPQENIRVWYAPSPVKEEQLGNDTRREVAELIREAFIASLNPDVVHITSLFEGYVDCAVTSIGRFNSKALVSVTLYDLIPLLNPEQYLQPNPRYQAYYQRKIDWLKKAAVMLGISDYACQEAKDALSIDSTKVVAISTAIESSFKKLDINNEQAANVLGKFGIKKPFLLYTGGADERKNLPRLIQAYAKLKQELRCEHQLVFAGRMPEGEVNNFSNIANENGLDDKDLIFTGYISEDDLVALYNLCKLYVFPSWHEGFGLPALEAMACGAPVIGANTTSLPEVIGLQTALFDPFDVASITKKMQLALTDDIFRKNLIAHSEQQVKKFSWNKTAKITISSWEALYKAEIVNRFPVRKEKLKLAFVSPLPPERTGIADYSSELLPVLANYYEIILILDQIKVSSEFSTNNKYCIKDVNWLRKNKECVDRVLYQVGNSPYHKHMLELVKELPGTVVLHDFYASGLMAWLEQYGGVSNLWGRALYQGHGYKALKDMYRDAEEAKRLYPVSWNFIENATGVVFHSNYSKSLSNSWYSIDAGASTIIPHLRDATIIFANKESRKDLNLPDNAFVICSFGFIDSSKLNHRLLSCLLSSYLARDKNCYLIFVGANHGGEYGRNLISKIESSGLSARIKITGFTEAVDFKKYLSIADLAIQLRTDSRGETSGTVLDCMNYGIPLIVNANGSMAELDKDAVWMLPDEFGDEELIHAIEALYENEVRRKQMGEKSKFVIQNQHSPEKCAKLYFQAIEAHHHRSEIGLPNIIKKLSIVDDADELPLVDLSECLAKNFPSPQPAKRLFIDITATCSNDLKTGIERVARALTLEFIKSPPRGYRVEPVYLSKIKDQWRYVLARKYTCRHLDIEVDFLQDEIADITQGDVVLGLDISGYSLVDSVDSGYQNTLRAQGVNIYYMVFDLLPVGCPSVFPEGADKNHSAWLNAVASLDGIIAISKHVSAEFKSWMVEADVHHDRNRQFLVDFCHLGADIDNSAPSKGMPVEALATLNNIMVKPSFLMVGTIEPRKGYAFALDTFEQLWSAGIDINLVIVGKEGWVGLPDDMRRDIPITINRLRHHPEKDKRLFLLEGISDEYLNRVYENSSCLIAASYDEGFGLPLIEAAQHKLPIIARDIPVFREVAGDYAFYFDSKEPEGLASAIQEWLELYEKGNHPLSDNMPWLTWEDSAKQLISKILI